MQVQTGHIGLNVTDVERSRQFYQDVFGFTVAHESYVEGHRFVFLSDGERLVLTLWEQSEGHFDSHSPGLHHLSFEVARIEDVIAFEQRLREQQVALIYDGIVAHREGKTSGGIFFTDPDGIRLEI
ncbi:MAG: VOC family protein [Chloroflexaceae bacterium]|nr:VOC family protein [Chloroflexaceae bacterium]